MNTSAVAQNLASRGRGEDKMLVHMTPSEVEGLQALAMSKGGSLTINPETGLPEAGSLSDTFKAVLPTLVGAGIMMIPGVNAAVTPWMVGLGVGGLEYARTGDLGRGLSAGLGAYGGAGITSGLMGGQQAATEAATDQTIKTVANTGPQGAKFATVNNAGYTNIQTPPPPQQGIQIGMNRTSTIGGSGSGMSNIPTNMGSYTAPGTETFAGNFDIATQGAKDVIKPGGFTNLVTNMGGGKEALMKGAATAGSIAGGLGAFDYKPMPLVEPEKSTYEGPYLPTERTATFRGEDAILSGDGREFRYFNPVNPYPAVRTAADGGLMSTAPSQEGRYLDGPGDGVSDSIPAIVDGEQPVLLSEGEYIIPAEVVSAVGNGSSDAGADKFTALVDTIMAKTRRVAKGKPNGADKLLKGLVPQTA